MATSSQAGFSFRKSLTIDHTRVAGSADLLDFPVLVRLTSDPDLQANVSSAQGYDLQFRAADGYTILDHEIESYDSGTGSLLAWVRIPVLDHDGDTTLYLYYGDPSITCETGNPTGVWARDYEAVYHLHDDFLDSTPNGRDATNNGSLDHTGQLADGQLLDGVNDAIDTGYTEYLQRFTYSVWLRWDGGGGSFPRVFAKENVDFEKNFIIHNQGDGRPDGALRYQWESGNWWSTTQLVPGQWYYVVVTHDEDDRFDPVYFDPTFYVNGSVDPFNMTFTNTPDPGSMQDPQAAPYLIGNRPALDRPFDGAMDEVRISSRMRSADWVQTEYNNQFQPSKGSPCGTVPTGFLCAGAEEVLPAAWTDVSVASGLDTAGNKDGGLAWGDFNDDGCLDVLVNTSNSLSALYMQNKSATCDGTFVDVTSCLAPGISSTRDRSVIWADLNNDGYLDFVHNIFNDTDGYLNNGPTPVSGCGPSWSRFGPGASGSSSWSINTGNIEGVAAIDYDNDGDLDLVQQDDQGPAFNLLENDGSGIFVNPPTVEFGPDTDGDFLAVADFDVDGDVDIVARIQTGDLDIWVNTGGAFTANANFEQASDGTNKGGVAFCDLDDDGDFDLFWTDNDTNQAWRNNGGNGTAVTWTAMGVVAPGLSQVDGVACGDADNDGDLDLTLTDDGRSYVLRNDGAFAFTDVTPSNFGDDDGEATSFVDYDRDGDVDIYFNQDGGNELWRNETNNNNYLVVKALQDVGGGTTRDAIGATLRLLDCGLSPVSGVREVNGGRGHGSQDPAYVHFGLPSCGTPSGPNEPYVVEARFLDGSVVQKAVIPSAIADYQLVTLTSTDSNDVAMCATAVSLVRFEAEALDGAVSLRWETGSETDNLGFHVYRSASPGGPYERITESVIPGLGSSPEGARYELTDVFVSNGRTYYYRLEDLETTGRTKRHGPVRATPLAGLESGEVAVARPRGELAEGELPVRLSHGDGSGAELRELRRDARGVVVELRTAGFDAFVQDDGAVRLEMPGLEAGDDALSLPVKRHWLELPEDVEAEVVSVRASSVSRYRTLEPAAWESADIFMTSAGTVRQRRRRAERLAGEELWSAARLVSTAYQGETRKALLELAPVRWDGASEELWHARRLVVRLRFKRTRRRRAARSSTRDVVAQLATRESGLYGVRFEDVLGSSRADVRTRHLRLSRHGDTAAFHVEPERSWFGPGSTLYFVSEGGEANPYGPEAVYELELGARGERMELRSARPTGPPVPFYRARLEREENLLYQASLVDAASPWLWELLMAGETKRYPFEVSGLASGGAPARLTVRLQGGSDFPVSPDHHVRALVNGVAVGAVRWNAKRPQTLEAELPAGVLGEGTNELALTNVGDTGARYSMVYLDGFTLDYSRRLELDGSQLEGDWLATGVSEVSGSGTSNVVVDVSEDTPIWLTGTEVSSGAIRFRSESGRRYLVAATAHAPEIRRPRPTTLRRRGRQADYVVLGPEAFRAAARPLLAHRRAQGLRSVYVSVEDVISEFGSGERRPEALRDFLAYAYEHWRRPALRYVVLFGDASYDPNDVFGLGPEHDRVPALELRTRLLWTASDPALAAVRGDDLLPDVAIGRLPAASVAEAEALVEKLLRFEQNGFSVRDDLVLVADNADVAGDFTADAKALERGLLAGESVRTVYLEELGVAESRLRLRDAFDDGAGLLGYLGHGGIHLWASENLLDTDAVDALAPQPKQPVVLTMNCLNGYFHFPFFDSLAESLVKVEDRGAIAAFSPSGYSLHAPAMRFQQALVRELVEGDHPRLGDAVLAAQQAFVDQGALPELVALYHLFGDPALTLR